MKDDADTGSPIEAWFAATGGATGGGGGTGGATGAPGPARSGGDGPDELHAPAARRPLSRRLLVLAALPWLAALAAGATWLAQRPAGAGGVSATPVPTVAAGVDPTPGGATVPAPPVADGVSAAAVIAVRAGAATDEYIDTAVVERTVDLGNAMTAATVRSVMLRRSGAAWSEPVVVRYAVVVGPVDGDIVALSPPWRIAPPPAQAPQWDWTAVDDASLRRAATETLAADGYADVRQASLRRTDAVPGVLSLRFEGTAPEERVTRPHEVWLSSDATSLVAGPAGPPPPVPVPAEQR